MTQRTVSGATLNTQSDSFRTAFFVLKEGFNSPFADIKSHEITRTENGVKKVIANKITGINKTGKSSIHGALLANSFIVSDEEWSKISKLGLVKKDFPGVFWYDDVAAIATSLYEEVYPKDDDGKYLDYEYPEQLEILGAAVFEAQEGGFPQVPLFLYPNFKILRAYHRKILGDDTARLKYWDAVAYCELKGADRPKGLKAGFKFEVANAIKNNPRKWTFRLIIKDPRK